MKDFGPEPTAAGAKAPEPIPAVERPAAAATGPVAEVPAPTAPVLAAEGTPWGEGEAIGPTATSLRDYAMRVMEGQPEADAVVAEVGQLGAGAKHPGGGGGFGAPAARPATRAEGIYSIHRREVLLEVTAAQAEARPVRLYDGWKQDYPAIAAKYKSLTTGKGPVAGIRLSKAEKATPELVTKARWEADLTAKREVTPGIPTAAVRPGDKTYIEEMGRHERAIRTELKAAIAEGRSARVYPGWQQDYPAMERSLLNDGIPPEAARRAVAMEGEIEPPAAAALPPIRKTTFTQTGDVLTTRRPHDSGIGAWASDAEYDSATGQWYRREAVYRGYENYEVQRGEAIGGTVDEARQAQAAYLDQLEAKLTRRGPTETLAPAPAVRYHTIERVAPETIREDPARFQYKALVDPKTGESLALKDVREYVPERAGVLQVWEDTSGQRWVVNGHHRLALAKRAKAPAVEAMVFREADGVTAEDARAIGALTNIAEGRGTAVDAGKAMRDLGLTPEGLRAQGLSLKEPLIEQGMALSQLEPTVFGMVTRGEVEVAYAAEVGRALPKDQPGQIAAIDLLRRELRRHHISQAAFREMLAEARDTPRTTESVATLFGAEEVETSLLGERAQVRAILRDMLSKDQRLFAYVLKPERAARLQEKGAHLDIGQAEAARDAAGQLSEHFDTATRYNAGVRQILNDAAQRVSKGERARSVAEDIYGAFRDAIEEDLGKTGGGGGGRGLAAAGRVEPKAPGGLFAEGEATAGEVTATRAPEGGGGAQAMGFRARLPQVSGLPRPPAEAPSRPPTFDARSTRRSRPSGSGSSGGKCWAATRSSRRWCERASPRICRPSPTKLATTCKSSCSRVSHSSAVTSVAEPFHGPTGRNSPRLPTRRRRRRWWRGTPSLCGCYSRTHRPRSRKLQVSTAKQCVCWQSTPMWARLLSPRRGT